jgi:adenosine deaminase
MFAEIPKCVNDLVSLRRITREALDDFAFHHVVYLELRSTPKRLLRDRRQTDETETCTKKEYIEAIISEMKEFERREEQRFEQEKNNHANHRLPLVPRFIVSIDRSASINDAMDHVKLAINMYQSGNEYIVGVDLGGNPTKNDFRDYEAAFQLARNAGLKVTIHCGEVPCGESANDKDEKMAKAFQEAEAVLRFNPDRLGHALLLPDSLQSSLDSSHIAIETCPTSNVMTLELATSFHGNLVEGLKCHPRLGRWLEYYPISVSTDDSGVFHTDPTKELLLLAIAYNLNEDSLKKIVVQSMDYAFCDDKTKERLKEAMSTNLAS